MVSIIRHRGPDSEGFLRQAGVRLGVCRLSIIDLETGNQPIASEDGRVTVVCNGEIYNYRELRRELIARGHRFQTGSDVEVIVHLYEELDVGCLERLRGMFAFALWDSHKRRLFLARDRLGIKPLHYALDPKGSIYFASELKAILACRQIDLERDLLALENVFTLGFVTREKTCFKKIRKLQPGFYLLYQEGDLIARQYWDVRFPIDKEEEDFSPGQWSEGLLEKLQESVNLHLRSDVEVGCWLSAGLDSSAVAALVSRSSSREIPVFSLDFENPRFDEITDQKILSDYSNYRLKSWRTTSGNGALARLSQAIWHCETPGNAGNWINTDILAEKSSEHVKVVLCGEGSDELLGGYRWYHLTKLFRPLSFVPRTVRRFLLPETILNRLNPGLRWASRIPGPINLERLPYLFGTRQPGIPDQLFSSHVKNELHRRSAEATELYTPAEFPRWSAFNQLQYYEMKTRLPDLVIQRVDTQSMAHSLEVRVPFLDHKLVEFCCRIPSRVKMQGLREKAVLREALKGILPSEIVNRRKRGLVAPVDDWMRRDLPESAIDLLSAADIQKRGYFQARTVDRLRQEHQKGRNHGNLLLRILATQLWDELFVTGFDRRMSLNL
jgi:asparagine synthase (glutamine-hydrolysing)